MTTENNFEKMQEMGSEAMENLNKIAELNTQMMKEFTDKQMEDFKFMMDQVKQQVKLATEVKDASSLKDFLEAQVKVAKEAGDHLVDDAKKRMEMLTGVREKYASFIKEEVDKLTEKFRKITPNM